MRAVVALKAAGAAARLTESAYTSLRGGPCSAVRLNSVRLSLRVVGQVTGGFENWLIPQRAGQGPACRVRRPQAFGRSSGSWHRHRATLLNI